MSWVNQCGKVEAVHRKTLKILMTLYHFGIFIFHPLILASLVSPYVFIYLTVVDSGPMKNTEQDPLVYECWNEKGEHKKEMTYRIRTHRFM